VQEDERYAIEIFQSLARIGRMDNGPNQKNLFARIVAWRLDAFFVRSSRSGIDDGGSRAGLSLLLFATMHIDALVNPQIEVIVSRDLRRQVLRDRMPLTSGGAGAC